MRVIQNNTISLNQIDTKSDPKKNRPLEKLFTFDYVFDKNISQVKLQLLIRKIYINVLLKITFHL